MPRVNSIAPAAGAPRRTARGRKPQQPQDRLSPRALFWRRLRKTLRPALWMISLGGFCCLGYAALRTLPSALPALPAAPQMPAPRIFHSGLAALGADLGLRIERVEVNGAVTVDPAQLAAAIGVQKGDPAYGFSLVALAQRVAQLGPVQNVAVERVLPGTLIINITERDALAIWQTTSNGKPCFRLIDSRGNIIADQDAALAKRRQPSLLLLSGSDAPQSANVLIAELKAAPVVLARVVAAQRVDGLRWNLILRDQTVVKLPDTNEAQAIGQLAALQTALKLLDRPVQDIDLRQPDRLVVRPYQAPAAPPPKPGALP